MSIVFCVTLTHALQRGRDSTTHVPQSEGETDPHGYLEPKNQGRLGWVAVFTHVQVFNQLLHLLKETEGKKN